MSKIILIIAVLFINYSLYAAPPSGNNPPPRGSAPEKKGPSPSGPRPAGPPGNHSPNRPPDRRPGQSTPGYRPPKKTTSENPIQQTANNRGQRIVLSDKDPAPLKTSVQKKSDGVLEITVFFNQPVKSVSVCPENILIDENILPEDTKMIFNKKVDSVHFEIKAEDVKNLELKNLEGINGKKIESIKVEL